jgi:hypothetical protein
MLKLLSNVLQALLIALLTFMPCSAESGPQPPCGGETFPGYPDPDKPPLVRIWDSASLGRDWAPPACTGWSTTGFSTLAVTTARFRHTTGIEGLLRRIGAISKLGGIRYWSTTRKQWQTLIVEAHALLGPSGDERRNDFPVYEIAAGRILYFQQEDNLSGKAIYRMRIASVSPDRLVYDIENISIIKYFFMPLFQPGEMQSVYFLDRESPEVWRYYSIARTGRKANSLAAGHDASSINRAVAYFRYLAGIPLDKEPPAAP